MLIHLIIQKISKTSRFSGLFTILIKASSLFKVSFIIGSHVALFSATSIMVPLSGAFGGLSGAIAVSFMRACLNMLCGGVLSFTYLAYHIPGLFAALYWTTSSPVIRVLLPLLCMAGFISHPIGAQAWAYSLFWLIPVFLYFYRKNNLFLTALGSTFTAHAVGSVIWIYADPMTPGVWMALIPIVVLERCVFATGMVVAHAVLTYCGNQWQVFMSILGRRKDLISIKN